MAISLTNSRSSRHVTQGKKAYIHHKLPDEMILQIFSHLGAKDLSRIMRVYTKWNQITNEPSLWRSLCSQFFLQPTCVESFKNQRLKEGQEKNTHKETYKRYVGVQNYASEFTCLKTIEIFTTNYTKVTCMAVDQKSLVYGDTSGTYHICLDYTEERLSWAGELHLFSSARMACENQKFLVGTTVSAYRNTLADIDLNQKKRPLRYLKQRNPVYAVAVHQGFYFSGGSLGHRQWNIETGDCIGNFRYEGRVNRFAIEENHANTIVVCKVVGEESSKISIWDMRTNSNSFEYATGLVTSVAIQDQTLANSTHLPKKFEIRDLRMNKSNESLHISDNDLWPFTAFQGDTLVGATLTNINLYNLVTGEHLKTFEAHKNHLSSIVKCKNQIFSASQGSLKIWGIPS